MIKSSMSRKRLLSIFAASLLHMKNYAVPKRLQRYEVRLRFDLLKSGCIVLIFTNVFSKHKSNRLYSCKGVRYTAGKETVWQADIQNKS